MASAHVAYDKKSGRIVAIHHGNVNEGHARQLAANYIKLTENARSKRPKKVTREQIAVISIDLENLKPGVAYKVDVKGKKVVETGKGVALAIGAPRRPF